MIAALGGLALWGHFADWTIPKFSALLGTTNETVEEWCEEHSVSEAACIECNLTLAPLGKDYGSDAPRRAAAEQAMRTGTAIITQKINVIEGNAHVPGCLLFFPVYPAAGSCGTGQSALSLDVNGQATASVTLYRAESPTLTVKDNPDPLRTDPVATVIDGCVGCGLCGENAHAAVLCPSFYRAEVVQNPTLLDRLAAKL